MTCPDCNGAGCPYCGGPDADYHTACFGCSTCNGTGEVEGYAPQFLEYVSKQSPGYMDSLRKKVKFIFPDPSVAGAESESLWAAHMGEDYYMLLNVPFVADAAWGDVVRCDENLNVIEVAERHGQVILVFFHAGTDQIQPALQPLSTMGCTVERYKGPCWAVSVPNHLAMEVVTSHLDNYKEVLEYERG